MGKVVSVDFEGVESGGGFNVSIPEGDYKFKIIKIVQKRGDKGPYLVFSLKAIAGPQKGINKTVPHTCSLSKASLWNLRNLLEATGKTIPSKAIKIDLDKLIGLELGGTAIDDEYKGKKKSVIASFFPVSDFVAPGSAKKSEDEDTDSDDSEDEDSEDTDSEEEESTEAEEESEDIPF